MPQGVKCACRGRPEETPAVRSAADGSSRTFIVASDRCDRAPADVKDEIARRGERGEADHRWHLSGHVFASPFVGIVVEPGWCGGPPAAQADYRVERCQYGAGRQSPIPVDGGT